MIFVKLFLIAVPVFFIIDMVWITGVARTFYKSQMGALLRMAATNFLMFSTAPPLKVSSFSAPIQAFLPVIRISPP